MKKLIEYCRVHIGRRGAVLLILSFVFFSIGLKALIDPSEDMGRFVVYTILPGIIRFFLWCIPALLGVIAAIRPYPKKDWYGFAALAIPATVIMLSYVGSFIGYLFHYTDFKTGWVNAFEWLLILAMILVTSGWQEVDDNRPGPVNRRNK